MVAHFHYDRNQLQAFLDDEFTADPQVVETHIETCPQCQVELETLAQTDFDWDQAARLLSEPHPAERRKPSDEEMENGEPGSEEPEGLRPAATFLEPTEHPGSLGRFARYEITEILGRGGMGIVMRGYDTLLNRHSAVKVLAPELATSAAARRRFSREAKSAAAVVHPHVVPIQTVDEHNGLPYLVMPVVEGRSLQQRVEQDGPLEIIEVIRIASQVAEGLAAAHDQGLVHRDIKPANILLENGVERVQITDFGLARAVDDASMTRSGVIAGTPQYMSPEQAHGDAIDHRSDLFSLGSVIYFMLTGRSPFRAETTMGVLSRIANDDPRPPCDINADVPAWLQQIVSKLLSKSPDTRYQTAQEVAELLEDCLAHVQQPTTTPLPASITVSLGPKHIRRPPVGRFLAAAAFAFSLIFAGVLIVLDLNKGTLTIESEADGIPIRILQGDDVVEKLTVSKIGKTLRVAAGNYVVEIDGDLDGINVVRNEVTLKRRGVATVKIVKADRTTNRNENQTWSSLLSNAARVPANALSEKTNAFNQRLKERYPNFDQPPLTDQELIACASWRLQYDSERPQTLTAGLQEIALKHRMLDGWRLDGGYTSLQIEAIPVECFQISLVNDSGTEVFKVRERYLRSSANGSEPADSPATGTPLTSAIKRFNARHKAANGQGQPPLTEDEVIAAIIHAQTNRDEADVSDSLFENLQNIARTRHLPEGAKLELISRFGTEGGGTEYTIWSIRVKMLQDEKGKEGWTYAFGIREQFIGVQHGDAASIHWGPPGKNGLQAGVRLSPPLLSYQLGQQIEVEFFYRNIIGKPMPGLLPNVFTYNEIEARDADGAMLEILERQEELIVGGAISTNFGDEPISRRSQPLLLLATTTTTEQRSKMLTDSDARTLILAKPGQSCRLKFAVGNYADGSDGTLQTGEVEFKVEDAVSKVDDKVSRSTAIEVMKTYFIGDTISDSRFIDIPLVNADSPESEMVKARIATEADLLIKQIEKSFGPCNLIDFDPSSMALVIDHTASGHEKISQFLQRRAASSQQPIRCSVIGVSPEWMAKEHEAQFERWFATASTLTREEVANVRSWQSSALEMVSDTIQLTPGKPHTYTTRHGRIPVTIVARRIAQHDPDSRILQVRLDMAGADGSRTSSIGMMPIDRAGNGLVLRQHHSDNFLWLVVPETGGESQTRNGDEKVPHNVSSDAVGLPPMSFDTLEEFLKPGNDLFDLQMQEIDKRLAAAEKGTAEHTLFTIRKRQLQEQWDLSIAQVKGMVAAAEAGTPVQLAPIVIPNNPTPWRAPLPDPLQNHDEEIASMIAGTWEVKRHTALEEEVDGEKVDVKEFTATFSKNMLIAHFKIGEYEGEMQYMYRISGDKIDLWDYDPDETQTDRIHPMLGSYTLENDTLRIGHHEQEMEIGQPQARPPVRPGIGLVYWELQRGK